MTNKKFYARWRLYGRLLKQYKRFIVYLVSVRYRLLSRLNFRIIRLLVFGMWKLWLRKTKGLENIDVSKQFIIVSNHVSYFDFFVLASVLTKQTIFLANSKLRNKPFVGWFMKLDTILYMDQDKPGYAFFRNLFFHLGTHKNIVIYPEGTRSRNGKMKYPKSGFVKLAIKANLPIIPVAMKGTFSILPPNKRVPKLTRCEVIFGKPIEISHKTKELADIFVDDAGRPMEARQLRTKARDEIAVRIMEIVRRGSGQTWDARDQAKISRCLSNVNRN